MAHHIAADCPVPNIGRQGRLCKPEVCEEFVPGSIVFPANLDSVQASIVIHTYADRDGSATDGTVFHVLLTASGDVDAAGVGLPAVRATNALFNEHEKSVAAVFSGDRRVPLPGRASCAMVMRTKGEQNAHR
jgi:hypothetical protein